MSKEMNKDNVADQSPITDTGDKEREKDLTDADEKEIMMQAFNMVKEIFDSRAWIMEGRGTYPYNDDEYKREVRYLFDEFDKLWKDTWTNIKSKSVDYRKKIISDYKKEFSIPVDNADAEYWRKRCEAAEMLMIDYDPLYPNGDKKNYENWLTLKIKTPHQ